ncbi:unnamed protein product [Nesidiocoris tenuis]|uniref:Uncharacterized protein n=2 Tax=Nesidiocoris tenuis TaxID=355587 RepID=A0A6H5GLN4_9HEMI|nr:NADH_ub_rd_NUHypothetical protein [Nesidiocoris tenuis]CAB0004894.1 unnamed protein product [Nesidiocoris tenuis]
MPVTGLTWSSLRKHYALMPLFACVGVGCVGCAYFCWRLAAKSPEVAWNKKGDQSPWNEYADKQFKFYSPNLDYSKIKSPAPKYD